MRIVNVRKNSNIYRGSHREWLNAAHYLNQAPTYLRTNLPVYFSNNRNSVNTYGSAVRYKTTKNLRLLNMSSVNTVQALFNNAKSDTVKNSINKAFRIINGRVMRASKLKHDMHVAVFICRMGYDGYYAPPIPDRKRGYKPFHSEIVLCKPHDVLKVNRREELREPPMIRSSVNNTIRQRVMNTNYSSHRK
jgi:hypothetical protein